MIRRLRIRILAFALAVVIGVFAILLANDLRAWRDLFQSDGLRYASSPTGQLQLRASTVLPSGLSGSLLGVGGDQRWLTALRKFTLAYRDTVGLNSLGRTDYILLNDGEAALRQVTQDADPIRASQAFNLLGVLVFREALPGTGADASLLQASLTDLQDAVRLDPADLQAKENLELGLRVLTAVRAIQQGHSAGNKTTKKRQGGYGGPPGEGY